MQHNEILHVGDIARITEKEVLQLLSSTGLYYTLPLLYLVLLDSTKLFYVETWIYLTLLHATMALPGSTTVYHYSA